MRLFRMKWEDIALGKYKDKGIKQEVVLRNKCNLCGEVFFVYGSDLRAVCKEDICVDLDSMTYYHVVCAEKLQE